MFEKCHYLIEQIRLLIRKIENIWLFPFLAVCGNVRPSCGATVFQRKTFNVYTHFAELVDTKTGKVDHHIDYSLVRTRGTFLGTNIAFTMVNGEKITVKLMFSGNLERVQEALRGLV